MDIRKIRYGANDPNVTSVSAASDIRNKIKQARSVDDESRRQLAWIFSGEEEEDKDKEKEESE
jgi:hypothetical protein